MKTKIEFKSFVLGTVLGAATLLAVAAATRPFIEEILPVRFLVLDVAQHGDPVNGKQTTVLRLAPFHGKIDQKSYDFCLKHETRDLALVTTLDAGYEIRTNDIIDFRAVGHLKLSPGSTVHK